MNQQIKSKWVEALRSGDYEQGSQYLKRVIVSEEEALVEDTEPLIAHCCLGVLCELYLEEHPDMNVRLINNQDTGDYYGFDGAFSALPIAVTSWADLSGDGKIPELVDRYDNLADINDSGQYDFNKIGDIIERLL